MGKRGIVLAALLCGVLGIGEARAQEHKYVGVKKCRSCHKKELMGEQYQAWKDGPHAKAFETLKSDEAIRIAKEKGLDKPPHEADECVKCHVTTHGVPEEMIRYGTSASDGVQCESCHGPGGDYRKKKTMSDHDKAVAAGMWEPGKDEKICGNCHNDESPTWDPTKFERADGTTVAFDFEQAKEKIVHPIPEDVKGRYLELEKKRTAERKAKGLSADEEEE